MTMCFLSLVFSRYLLDYAFFDLASSSGLLLNPRVSSISALPRAPPPRNSALSISPWPTALTPDPFLRLTLTLSPRCRP